MILNKKTGFIKLIVEIICMLYLLLFVYAAMNKGLDFEKFQVELGQSPLLSAFAGWISWTVLLVEFAIVFFLLFPKTHIKALYAGFCLMCMFTAYIFIMLNYSSFLPCSCGGILEKMNWQQHFLFNVFFVLIAGVALLLHNSQINRKTRNSKLGLYSVKLFLSFMSSCAIVVILFLASEKIMHHENPFLRSYPQHPILFTDSKDLQFNSYYFAGYTNNKIYLANYTNPLTIVSFSSNLKHKEIIKISFHKSDLLFSRVRIIVRGNYFYLLDGTIPKVFRGEIRDWKIKTELKGSPYFTLAEPVDSTSVVFRANNGQNLANILGVFNAENTSKIVYNKSLLQKQIDGVFDTDGMLAYSEQTNRMIYVYYYRNEFIIADKRINLITRGHTIDTISKAKIKVAYLRKGTERTMAAPPQLVNAHIALTGNLLFIHSKIKGQYEDNSLWDQSSIIDLYDINKKTYVFSFSIYNRKGKKMHSFFVTRTHLYALIGNEIVVYELRSILRKELI